MCVFDKDKITIQAAPIIEMSHLGRRLVQAAFAACAVPISLTSCNTTASEPEDFSRHVHSNFDALKLRRKKNRVDNLMVVAGSGNPQLAAEICEILGVPTANATIDRFSDGMSAWIVCGNYLHGFICII